MEIYHFSLTPIPFHGPLINYSPILPLATPNDTSRNFPSKTPQLALKIHRLYQPPAPINTAANTIGSSLSISHHFHYACTTRIGAKCVTLRHTPTRASPIKDDPRVIDSVLSPRRRRRLRILKRGCATSHGCARDIPVDRGKTLLR